ncbi:DUF2510 domain-containing protein [Egicoccus sp. AB-alg2]|uniref:DUF2510 domain-containing protein n=1 Tax=Egicoccus sp. AB-alg2 TaxID=3242693 RepID=UPI00359DFCE0
MGNARQREEEASRASRGRPQRRRPAYVHKSGTEREEASHRAFRRAAVAALGDGHTTAGWYPDPWSEGSVRHWNGLEWTTDTRHDAQPR